MKSLVGILMISFSLSAWAQTTPAGQETETPPKEKTPVSAVAAEPATAIAKTIVNNTHCSGFL